MMKEFNKARELYSKIHLAINDKKITQSKVSEAIEMTPQTFSDNMTRLKNGKYTSLKFLLQVQEVLNIELVKI